jgi:hypothetical protein
MISLFIVGSLTAFHMLGLEFNTILQGCQYAGEDKGTFATIFICDSNH